MNKANVSIVDSVLIPGLSPFRLIIISNSLQRFLRIVVGHYRNPPVHAAAQVAIVPPCNDS